MNDQAKKLKEQMATPAKTADKEKVT